MSAAGATSSVKSRGIAALFLTILVLAVLPYLLSTYYLGLVIEILIFAVFAMSLDLLIGYAGMASLGHAAYFGVGAYAVGLLAIKLHWSVWSALPAALIVVALVAALFGLLALRTRGSYFLMITLALSQVAWGIAFGWRSLTGGDDGLPSVPRPELAAGWSLAGDRSFYFFILLLVGVAVLLLTQVATSPFGFALRGIRESETRMQALGYDVWRYKFAAFIIAAVFAGLAGALYAYYNRFVSPDYLGVFRSAEVLLMVILGGAGTLVGPAIGAAVIVLLENVISAYTERWLIVIGTIYILVALFAPNGIIGFVRDVRARRVKS
ncbi:MAG: branched-chain amino acid ABC transporter permease [Xanthobacteraceae bacterium]